MNIAVVVAAGSGLRMKNVGEPKQFLYINNKPLMVYSLETFNIHPRIDYIIVVTSEEHISQVEKMCSIFKLSKVKAVVKGGLTRQESVLCGLEKAMEYHKDKEDIVLIHDAARPLVSLKIIGDNIDTVQKYGAAVTAINASDTILSIKEDIVSSDLDRNTIYQAQTPQSFRLEEIYRIHKKAQNHNATDDASLFVSNGGAVHLVNGDKKNFKITTDDDLLMLKALLQK